MQRLLFKEALFAHIGIKVGVYHTCAQRDMGVVPESETLYRFRNPVWHIREQNIDHIFAFGLIVIQNVIVGKMHIFPFGLKNNRNVAVKRQS
jgi:hypothetical protein